jgi:DNA polymerase III delta prime subunit
MTAADGAPSAADRPAALVIQHSIVNGDITIVEGAPAGPADRPDLLILLESVRRTWIEGVLERSVHDAARLELGKEARADAVAHPWASILELPDRTARAFPPEKAIGEIFDEVGSALLILGLPGSGKTITLLELARELIARAAAGPEAAIPVVFNLSTWTGRHSLADWLVEELKSRYFVPERKGRAWLEDHRLVLLLDGLDEVRDANRLACVEAINAFVRDVGVRGLVVCSRLEEYAALHVRLTLLGAIYLQPLTPEEVDRYLTRAGARLDALRLTLRGDSQLQTLAETPLMLSVMTLAYQGLSADALSQPSLDSVEERRDHLFTTYIERMLSRRGTGPRPYARERTLHWLSWLARRMRERAESVFLIERLQPDWLASRLERWTYMAGSRLLGGAALGLVLGAILDLSLNLIGGTQVALPAQLADFGNRLLAGLAFGVANGLVAGVIDAGRFERERATPAVRARRAPLQSVVEVAVYVLGMVLVSWLIVGLLGDLDQPIAGLIFGLLVGLLFGLFFGGHRIRRVAAEDIRTVEALRWSWADARRSSGRGLLAGLTLGGILGLVSELTRTSSPDGGMVIQVLAVALLAVMAGALGALLGTAFGGLRSSIIPTKAAPNQGIELSIRNAVLSGLVVGVMVGLVLWVAVGLMPGSGPALEAALVGGMFFGLLAALWDGVDVIHHYTLRAVLAIGGHLPLDCARFLDYAAALVLLQKAGGGYLFVHRVLLDHFAKLEPKAGPASPARSRSLSAADQESARHTAVTPAGSVRG